VTHGIPSTITIKTSVIVTDLIANLAKIPVLEIAKPELFYKLR
jgi:hypothetical protein